MPSKAEKLSAYKNAERELEMAEKRAQQARENLREVKKGQ
jgi:hypothetical protein